MVLREGKAMRIVLFHPGEEGTYVDNVNVVLYESGVVNFWNDQENCTIHISKCEILWSYSIFETAGDGEKVVSLRRPK